MLAFMTARAALLFTGSQRFAQCKSLRDIKFVDREWRLSCLLLIDLSAFRETNLRDVEAMRQETKADWLLVLRSLLAQEGRRCSGGSEALT
jgi:hypothetical protein